MCLAVPLRIVEKLSDYKATVEADGLSRMVDISLLESVAAGDYVIVHAGFAIEKLDPQEADARIELFSELARLTEGGTPEAR